jgi:uncharacterized protein YkwD
MRVRVARSIPAALIIAFVIGASVWATLAGPVSASTESSMAGTILAQMNHDRAALGLVALRVDSRVAGVAVHRAEWMASTGTMTHDSYGGAVWDAVEAVGVHDYSSGEAIGSTNAPFGAAAAEYIYGLWRNSPEHWALMMSDSFNYVGVGVGYRGATGDTFASIVFVEGPDASRPVAEMTGAGQSGTSIFFTWTGRDGRLQSHTAGLRDFDVEYRVDGGAWTVIRAHTTSTQLILANRTAGRTYSVRVRDRDRRNNLSAWSSARTVSVR